MRNLLKEAKADFPALSCPELPALKKSVRQKRIKPDDLMEELIQETYANKTKRK